MRKYKFFNSFYMIIAIIFGLSCLMPVTTVFASDESNAMSQAPDGIPVGDYFSILSPQKPSVADANYPFTHNYAQVSTSNPDIVTLASGNKSGDLKDGIYGAVWSNPNKDNYIDISKKQTVSVWLYFGSGVDQNSIINGEGMSLVLQNDPRKNDSNQSQAMGAGYQGMGVLGYDRSVVNYKIPLVGLSSYETGTLPNSSYVAGTAIKNSIALDFDASREDGVSHSGLSQNGPLLLYNYHTSSWGTTTGYNEYTLNGYDTTNGNDPFGKTISSTYPGYNDLIAGRSLDNNALRLGNNGGHGYGTISMTYPGIPITYQPVPFNNVSTNDYKRFSNNQLTSVIQAYTQPASLVDGSDNDNNTIYWHHVTYTWNPARNADGTPTTNGLPVSGGTPASISYAFNDKFLNGSKNDGSLRFYKEVTDKIPVDPTQFNLTNGDTKVYWGLTGANSTDSNVFSKIAIFESIPALATATASSKITDNSLNNQVITDSDSTTTVPDRTVFNNDKLTFNYNLKWDPDSSHQNWNKIVSKIRLPQSDVNFSKSGTITYHTNAGQSDDKAETEEFPLIWNNDDSANEIKHQLAYSLGTYLDKTNNPNNYTSADIDFDGTAVNDTSSVITVDPEASVFTGDNAIETTSSPKFLISSSSGTNKLLQLEVSKSLAFQDVNYQATSTILQRKTPFILNVTSLKSPWTMQVSSNGLFLNGNGTKFNGNLIYKTNTTGDPIVLSNTPQQIAENLNSYDTNTTDDIAGKWTSNTGLLLQPTQADNQVGHYSGTVTWTVGNYLGNK